ncbi:hypothetical protein GBA52_019476, partial [Prunus armeniaca]
HLNTPRSKLMIYESYSLQIVSAIQSPFVDGSSVGPVVEDTKALLTQITGDDFTHIRHVANGVAHRLARYASHIGTTTTWFEEPPDLLVNVLYKECNLYFFTNILLRGPGGTLS